MKNIGLNILHIKLSVIICLTFFSSASPQNWPTISGNNQHNGLTEMTAPTDVSSIYWTINSSSTVFGNSIFTYGNKFVNSRVIFSPSYTAKIECRSLDDGSLLWDNQISSSSIMYCVGFNEFAVYAHDYSTDSLYALNPSDGSVLWVNSEFMFGGKSGVLFACNGDPILFGRRLDKFTGQTIWQYNYIVPVGPDAGYAMFNDTYYHWTGSITTPKKVFALNTETGAFKYESMDLPGDGDQEIPLTIGADGTIYIARDGGLLYALEDDGNGINIKWTYSPVSSITGYLGSSNDGHVYLVDGGRVRKLDSAHGTVVDTSQVTLASGFLLKITVDSDGKVIVCNAEAASGKYYCFSSDLQTSLWELNVPYNYYCGASLGKEGAFVVTGAGTQISAYKFSGTRKPAADFFAETTLVLQGSVINFFDQSSYQPTSWEWFFPGSETNSSTQQNPENILYNTPGIYEVSLITTNSFGTDTLKKSCYIEVKQANYVNEPDEMFDEFKLYQNFPNPFNPSTSISWEQPIESKTTIKIYDVLGKELMTILDEEIFPGFHQAEFNAGSLPSGIYFYRIFAGNFTQIKKMMLLK